MGLHFVLLEGKQKSLCTAPAKVSLIIIANVCFLGYMYTVKKKKEKLDK